MTRLCFSKCLYEICFLYFVFSALNVFCFFLSLSSEHKEGVVRWQSCDSVWTQLPVFVIGCFSFLWKRRWFPGWRGMAAPLHFSPHLPPLGFFTASHSVSRSLSLLRLDQVACEHNTQTLTVTALYSSSSHTLLLFHQAGSPLDHQPVVGKSNPYRWGSGIKRVLVKFSLFPSKSFGALPIVFVVKM